MGYYTIPIQFFCKRRYYRFAANQLYALLLHTGCNILFRFRQALFYYRLLFYNNPFAVKQAIVAINNYGYSGTEKILLLLHEYNLKNIGINNGGSSDADLLKELAVKIIAA